MSELTKDANLPEVLDRIGEYLPQDEGDDAGESAFNMKTIFYNTYKELRDNYEDRFADNRKFIYLAGLAATGRVNLSAKMAGVKNDTIRTWRGDHNRNNVPPNASLFCEIEENMDGFHDDALVAEAIRRGAQGVKKPVYYQGEVVGHEREFSDNLLMFAIKARMPQFKENQTNVNIEAGDEGAVNVNFVMPEVEGEVKEVREEDRVDVTPKEVEGEDETGS